MERLHDLALPAPVSWLPQTTAWYVALVAVLALLAAALFAWRRDRARNRYRRDALSLLSAIAERGAYEELPSLVKRTALACRPRTEVASLAGDEWLRFLDESYGGEGFTRGPGRALTALAYEASPEVDGDALVPLIRAWILEHDVRA